MRLEGSAGAGCVASQISQAIATAIRDSGLNLNPSVEDNAVKVPLPKYVVNTREGQSRNRNP